MAWKTELARMAALSLLGGALCACGGGGGGGGTTAPVSSTPPPVTSTAVKDVAQGTVTGFGSVYLDGERYTTDSAKFFKDGSPSTQDDLRVGMVVKLSGDFGSHSADVVAYDEDVKGPVDEVNGNVLTVMGQVVVVTPGETVLEDGLDVATVQPGDVLEVSGLRGADDQIDAAYVELKPATQVDSFKVIGEVRDMDAEAKEFRIGTLTIDYASAVVDDDVGALREGMLVEVKDDNAAYTPLSLSLMATRIEGERRIAPDEDDEIDDVSGAGVEVEGVISEVTSSSTFLIGGVQVTHDAQTVFIYGDASEIAVGTKVEAQGTLLDDDTLDATKIKFARNSARVSGLVELVDTANRRVTVFGVDVHMADDARFEDDRDGMTNFGMADLLMSDFVEIRGNLTADGIVGRELRRDEAGDTELRGPATNIDTDAHTLDVLGVSVATDAATQFGEDDHEAASGGDDSMSAADFFGLLHEGQSLVEAKWDGTVTDPTIPARELELED